MNISIHLNFSLFGIDANRRRGVTVVLSVTMKYCLPVTMKYLYFELTQLTVLIAYEYLHRWHTTQQNRIRCNSRFSAHLMNFICDNQNKVR